MRQTAKGRGDTILHEKKVWSNRAFAEGTTDKIPEVWRFSVDRLNHLFAT
jgi:hypothetical protein